MEDAATAEISRSQLWQWLHHPDVRLDDGRPVTRELMIALFDEELENLRGLVGDERFEAGRYEEAREMIQELVVRGSLADFMTLRGYEELT